MKNGFFAVRPGTIRGNNSIDFDIFVRVASKHVLYGRRGETLEGKRLDRLKEKHLDKIFIPDDQKKYYDAYLNKNLDEAYGGNFGKPLALRAQIIQGAMQAAAEDLMSDPLAQGFYDVAKNSSGRFVTFLLTEPGAYKAILDIPNKDKSIAIHGVAVATLSIGIAQKLKLVETHPMSHLILGCLIHDIEHFHSGLDIGRPLVQLDPAERTLYEEHPTCGTARLRDAVFFDPIVTAIVLQHEESIDGSGFPNGLRESKLSPLAMIAAVANQYDRYVSFEGLTPKDALKRLLIEQMGRLQLDDMKALQDFLKEQNIIEQAII